MRARSLKPSMFKNELLAIADPLYTLIFEGLWCAADRAGRLEDRPGKLHIEINPGRSFEGTERSLVWLAENGFILRYEVAGKKYILVIEFTKHQKPHVNEKPSVIPPPTSTQGSKSVDSSTTKVTSEHNQGVNHLALTPDSGLLTPDSGLLDYEHVFGTTKAAYPKFSGRQDWISAEHHWRIRIDDGAKPEDLLCAVRRYGAFVEAGGVSSPQFVLTPGKFFSAADKPWEQAWTPPPKPETREEGVRRRFLSGENDPWSKQTA